MTSNTPETALDLLIIGGGVVGLGSALDASSRGLTVGLIEKNDFASGTSSKSSRLAHGGLRYLEHLEFGLVHEALRERGLLLDTIAPHLTHSVEFVLPTTSLVRNIYNRLGVEIYYLLSRIGAYGKKLPRPGSLSRKSFATQFKALDQTKFHRGVTYFDAQIDDARHTIALARTASGYGADVVNYAEFLSYQKHEASGSFQVTVRSDNCESQIFAQTLLFATGPWTNDVLPREGDAITPSKGAHIVVPKSAIDLSSALISRTNKSVLFILPWENEWIIGTTDNPYLETPDSLVVTENEILSILQEANLVLAKKLIRSDVVASYIGIRPLAAPKRIVDTAKASREHLIDQVEPRVFSVIGGKYTTYRVMAKDAIDQVSLIFSNKVSKCLTQNIALVGARDDDSPRNDKSNQQLVNHYGDEVAVIEKLIAASPENGELLDSKLANSIAEVKFAISHQGARTPDDVISRRLRINTIDAELAVSVEAKIVKVFQTLDVESKAN